MEESPFESKLYYSYRKKGGCCSKVRDAISQPRANYTQKSTLNTTALYQASKLKEEDDLNKTSVVRGEEGSGTRVGIPIALF